MFFTLEFCQPVIAGHGDIAHDLADNGFALMGQFDVFHTGAGNLGHRFYALYIF